MRYLALATDYDGTIAHDGVVDTATLAGMERLLASGRKLIMVTGRELDQLQQTFDHLELFEWVVAENGALLYRPSSKETILLNDPPSDKFIATLKERGVGPISVGGVIVATWEPHEKVVLETIRDLGLELHVIFNKGAVMVLPSNVNKSTGLAAALERMGLSAHNVVGVGDAENDHSFLSMCECSAAVANALPAVKQTADIVLRSDHGAGVVELMDEMVKNDLAERDSALSRRNVPLGKRADGTDEGVRPYGTTLLVAGPSGSGKSTVAAGVIERLIRQNYQVCIIDPEGDYQGFEGAVVLGTGDRSPALDEVLQMLQQPLTSIVVNMIGTPISDRPGFFLTLLPRLLEMRASTGRPHWLIVDEAHHLLPTTWEPAAITMPQRMGGLMLITVHPKEVSPAVLSLVDTAIAVGPTPMETLQELCEGLNEPVPDLKVENKASHEVYVWSRGSGQAPYPVTPEPSQTERRRHIRKYSEGALPPDRSFYFRGPEEKLNLRAQNLMLFMQLGDGVDDETWTYHLEQGDVSEWFRDCIKDTDLAAEAEEIEQNKSLSPADSRQRIRAAVEKRFTLPVSTRLPMPGTDVAPRFVKEGPEQPAVTADKT